MGSEPYIGSIMMFGGNFAPARPTQWAMCEGQLLEISKNEALHSLIQTTYGGDGRTTFALPNLKGRIPVHAGDNGYLPPINLGESKGEATVTLKVAHLPPHSHKVRVSDAQAYQHVPTHQVLANTGSGGNVDLDYFSYDPKGTVTPVKMGSQAVSSWPGSSAQSHSNLMPALGITYCIALTGTYPARS